MKRLSGIFGWLGLLFALGGGFGYAVFPDKMLFFAFPWILAFVFVFFWVAGNAGRLSAAGKTRAARYGAGSAAGVILVLGILVIAAMLSRSHHIRWDMTSNQRYSLAPQTLKILKGLSEDVEALAFYSPDMPQTREIKDLLDQYSLATPRFSYDIVDPDRHPSRAEAAGVNRYDTLVITSGDKSEKIMNAGEAKVTNAILRITQPGKKRVYFLTGHGEKAIDDDGKGGYSRVKTTLENQNYDVKPLLLMQAEGVPHDAAVLVIAGPTGDLLASEREAIGQYLNKGGRVLFMLDPRQTPELALWLGEYRVDVGDDMIVDKMSRLFGADYLMPLVAQYGNHPITDGFSIASFFPLARSVSTADRSVDGISVEKLAETSDQAWAEKDLDRLTRGEAAFDPDVDKAGPVSVAVVGTVVRPGLPDTAENGGDLENTENPTRDGKFVVFGDSDFASNNYKDMQGNGDLFLNSVSWLAEEGDLTALRPRETDARPLVLSAVEARLAFWLPVVVIPLAVLFIAGIILSGRRKHQ
jgi:ABC-type uncharacterized transport system involved in gliding motility auxiliary subunit